MRYSIKFVAKKSIPFGLGMSKKFHGAVWDGGWKKQWHEIGIVATEMCMRTRTCMVDVEAADAAELSVKTEICQAMVEFVWKSSKNPFVRMEISETWTQKTVYKADL